MERGRIGPVKPRKLASLRMCADAPQGIPHLVDKPRARRCDQHARQRHLWTDANGFRRRNGKPELEWVPDPLTPERRREALSVFANDNATDLRRNTGLIRDSVAEIRKATPALPPTMQAQTNEELARIDTLCRQLDALAERLGANPWS